MSSNQRSIVERQILAYNNYSNQLSKYSKNQIKYRRELINQEYLEPLANEGMGYAGGFIFFEETGLNSGSIHPFKIHIPIYSNDNKVTKEALFSTANIINGLKKELGIDEQITFKIISVDQTETERFLKQTPITVYFGKEIPNEKVAVFVYKLNERIDKLKNSIDFDLSPPASSDQKMLDYLSITIDTKGVEYIDGTSYEGIKRRKELIKNSSDINQINKFLKSAPLIDELDKYLKKRKADNRDYLSIFGSMWGYSKTQKILAVNALKDALIGKEVDLSEHLDVLRNGRLGKKIRGFVKNSANLAHQICGVQCHTITGFVNALESKKVQFVECC